MAWRAAKGGLTTAPDRNRLMVVDSGDDVSALQQVVALDHFRRTGHTGHTGGHSFDNSSSSRSHGSRSRSGDEREPKQPANNNNNNNDDGGGDGDGDGGGGGGGGDGGGDDGGFVNTAPTSCPPIFGPHVGGESVANITKRMMSLVPLPGGAGTCKTLN